MFFSLVSCAGRWWIFCVTSSGRFSGRQQPKTGRGDRSECFIRGTGRSCWLLWDCVRHSFGHEDKWVGAQREGEIRTDY